MTLDNKIHFSFPCKNNDKFCDIEKLLYEEYPEYKNSDNYFTLQSREINRYKSFEENKIKNGDIIILNKGEEE